MSLFGSASEQPIGEQSGGDKKQKGKKGAKNINNDLFKIIKLIIDRQLDPCIIFSFSKKDCESYALQTARLDFNNAEEKALVERVFLNAMDALSDDDKALPAVQTILPLLKNGVGIHHGGLLPILKEVIEILFQEGLIKCLFATETFSIGINMPAKTVVFTATRKYDGEDFRWITSGEYIQMSGRAGRRGKDDKGIVIQMLDENMEPEVAKNMIYGASDPLFSSYHVGYNMVLNMLRVEDANPENLIRSSFHQFQQERNAPELERQAVELRKEAANIIIENEDSVQQYDTLTNLLKIKKKEINDLVMQPIYCLPFLQIGRLVHVSGCDDLDWGWGAVVNCRKTSSLTKGNRKPNINESNFISSEKGTIDELEYIIDVLLDVWVISENNTIKPKCTSTINTLDMKSEMIVVHVALNNIDSLSAVRLNMPKDIISEKPRADILKSILEVRRRFEPPSGSGIPLLDYVTDLAIPSDLIQPILAIQNDLNKRLSNSLLCSLSNKDQLLNSFDLKRKLLKEADDCFLKARDSQAITMKDQLKKMKRVLRKLDFISAENVLAPKGRFSCELSTADELVVTNMVFDGAFNNLSVPQTVALLSCFVHKEESKSSVNIRNDMQTAFKQLQTIARSVAKVCLDAKLITDEDDYVSGFNPGLVDVTYAWCTGAKFADICKLTDVFEGSTIRVLRRLEELLRQLASASLAIGNSELKSMFEEGAAKIRRGVVFAASLYL